ncbi:MAG: 50S ribosomal protein L1 [Coriobacteriia bacterium]|nr:50S ribosomal protein L1 [Coriobacteriia bacterium]
MPKITKNQKIQRAKVVKGKLYSPLAAARLAQEIAVANFDETLEVHLRLGVDTRQADQQVRGSVSLPNGTGKTVRVLVFAEGDKAKEAEAAGAEVIGSDELITQIQGGFLGFDAAVATPDLMAKVGRLGKILGPRGLMPNPKLGTVTNDVTRIVGELKAGRVEYRADRYGICHVPIGKLSFTTEKLVQNYATLLDEIIRVKPAASKGRYLKTITFASSMGPGISIDTTKTRNLLVEDAED